MTIVEQQPAASAPQMAAAVRPMAPPRFNYRIATGFERYQAENIEILRKKLGTSDTAVLRTAIDLLSFVNSLPVETDPSIFLNNWIVRRTNLIQNGE
jgi:hypothetical protein